MFGTLATIGVYGWGLPDFLDALRDHDVQLLIDVRQRRSVRGSQYAWANAQRLQAALGAAGIEYAHHLELAPTTELRELQYEEDARQKVGKRSRVELYERYAERYQHEILDPVDLGPIIATFPAVGATAFFCVERDPEACHRSLVAARFSAETGLPVEHLLPPGEAQGED